MGAGAKEDRGSGGMDGLQNAGNEGRNRRIRLSLSRTSLAHAPAPTSAPAATHIERGGGKKT